METPPVSLLWIYIFPSISIFHPIAFDFFHYETLDCFASLLENLELPIFTHCTVSAGDVNPNFPHCTEFINISQLWQLHIFTWIWQTDQSVICMFCKVRSFLSSTFFDPAPRSTKRDSYIVLDMYCKIKIISKFLWEKKTFNHSHLKLCDFHQFYWKSSRC